MTDTLQQNLISALSELNIRFHDEPESLHYAVALVFSSIFKKHSIPCIIVGGQSAAYWLRSPGSTDIDFVSSASDKIAEILEKCGFQRSNDISFRYTHIVTNVYIELVGERIEIADLKSPGLVEVKPHHIGDLLVRSLMPGPAEVLDPVAVFVNYVESSCIDSIWFSYKDEGAIAIERALALLTLYKDHLLTELRNRFEAGEVSEKIVQVLRDKFKVSVDNG